jgi:predicted DNA binding protein
MNNVDKILKEALNLVEYTKDVTKNNIINLNLNASVTQKLTDDQLHIVLLAVDSSITQGYHRGISNFQKTVEVVVGGKK